jgi:hypothetical protein
VVVVCIDRVVDADVQVCCLRQSSAQLTDMLKELWQLALGL